MKNNGLSHAVPAVAALLLLFLGAVGCTTHCVDTHPNTSVAVSHDQILIVENATSERLVLLPRRDDTTGTAPRVIPPGGRESLVFVLGLEENQSPTHEHEIVQEEGTSPYLLLGTTDLKLRARFGENSEREVRVQTGPCVFGKNAWGRSYTLHLDRPPLPGVPALKLCP